MTLISIDTFRKKYEYVPNMSYALGLLKNVIKILLIPEPQSVKTKISIITEMITKNTLPIRPNRSNPREQKPKRPRNSMPYKRVI